MAVVTPLNNFLGPEDDTVTTHTYYRIQNTEWVEGPAPVASAYGPITEEAGTRVCGYAIKNSGLTVV